MVRAVANGANEVRRHRRSADITQADLAQAIGVSRQTIISIEGGNYAPSVFLALQLAKALDTTVEALFFINTGPAKQQEEADERHQPA